MDTRILIVDDEDVIRGVIHEVLSDDGYDVFEASTDKLAAEAVSRSCRRRASSR